jgi:hypothetical protein
MSDAPLALPGATAVEAAQAPRDHIASFPEQEGVILIDYFSLALVAFM